MRAVITGTAGFIGSRLAAEGLRLGWSVAGLDCLRPYYDLRQKARNLALLESSDAFEFTCADLATADLRPLLEGADVIFHLAGQPGVRGSWRSGFADYCTDNVLATQRLLEAAVAGGVPRVVYSSSSSIYGDADAYPVTELTLPRPISPYGVSKLAGEHLCLAYAAIGAIEAVALRYFTVYGPGQRPDMAIHGLIRAALTGAPFELYGDGGQVRDFTFVADVVDANLLAAVAPLPGASAVLNIAGGGQATLADVIAVIEEAAGVELNLVAGGTQAGDVRRTGGDTSAATELLAWRPRIALEEGIAQQLEWQATLHRVPV
jgi:UDP-glucuronate 4-epimerase